MFAIEAQAAAVAVTNVPHRWAKRKTRLFYYTHSNSFGTVACTYYDNP